MRRPARNGFRHFLMPLLATQFGTGSIQCRHCRGLQQSHHGNIRIVDGKEAARVTMRQGARRRPPARTLHCRRRWPVRTGRPAPPTSRCVAFAVILCYGRVGEVPHGPKHRKAGVAAAAQGRTQNNRSVPIFDVDSRSRSPLGQRPAQTSWMALERRNATLLCPARVCSRHSAVDLGSDMNSSGATHSPLRHPAARAAFGRKLKWSFPQEA